MHTYNNQRHISNTFIYLLVFINSIVNPFHVELYNEPRSTDLV